MKRFDLLLSRGIIAKIIGDIPNEKFSLAMVVQARSKPKHPFNAFIALSKILSEKPLTVYVDNLYSQIFFKRSRNQQFVIDEEYRQYFSSFGCEVFFSKEIFEHNNLSLFPCLVDFASQVPIGELFGCLPAEKRLGLEKLKLDEVIHLLLEMILIEEVKKHQDVLLVGHGSQAIIATHRNVIKKPLPAIVVPRFLNVRDVDDYIKRISEL